jgi:ABC-type Mn2+/Zn2+ transport system ATPase subunit
MRLSKVSFRYRRRSGYVIADADNRLSPGDIVELTGANGAGKSTLLRLLAGLARPTRGAVTGRPPVVGFAPDRLPAEQPFTVAGYLGHMARVRGGARWEPWTERLTMTHLLDVKLGELSKGSAHKVGLVQALMAGPGLLILDEPFAGLDGDTRGLLPGIAAEVAARGGIVVVSDHQGGLRALPHLRRWTLADGLLAEAVDDHDSAGHDRTHTNGGFAAERGRQAGRDTEALVTVEVRLPARDVREFLARARGEGYQARALPPAPEEGAPSVTEPLVTAPEEVK